MDDVLKQNMVKDLGLDKLAPQEQEEALLTMGRLLFQAVIARVLEVMNEADKEEFEILLSDKSVDSGVVYEFLQKKVEDLDKIVKEEIVSLKKEAIDFMEGIK